MTRRETRRSLKRISRSRKSRSSKGRFDSNKDHSITAMMISDMMDLDLQLRIEAPSLVRLTSGSCIFMPFSSFHPQNGESTAPPVHRYFHSHFNF